jgi:hypothetical protein
LELGASLNWKLKAKVEKKKKKNTIRRVRSCFSDNMDKKQKYMIINLDKNAY